MGCELICFFFFWKTEYYVWAFEGSSGFRFYRSSYGYGLCKLHCETHISQYWYILRSSCVFNAYGSVILPNYSSIWNRMSQISLCPVNILFLIFIFCIPVVLSLFFSFLNFILQIKKSYFSRQSQRTLNIPIMGDKIPLYGSGASLNSVNGTAAQPVPLGLNFVVRSKAHVLGKLVKTKFNRRIKCALTYDPKKHNKPISLKNSCTYDWSNSTINKNKQTTKI